MTIRDAITCLVQLAALEVDAAAAAEELEDIKQSWTPPRRASLFNRRHSSTFDGDGHGHDRTRGDDVT